MPSFLSLFFRFGFPPFSLSLSLSLSLTFDLYTGSCLVFSAYSIQLWLVVYASSRPRRVIPLDDVARPAGRRFIGRAS